jgi:glycerol kinase
MRVGAIDQGTTSTRVLLASEGGGAEIKHSIRHEQHRPKTGWVEHDAAELLANVRACAKIAGRVTAIGLANQGESCMAWDAASGEPLSPVIVWQDNRTESAVQRLRSDGCEALVRERAGLPLDTYFSASKLAWILQNIPEASRRMRRGRLRLGTTDAYFLDRLTGVFATDVTTASRTSLMNLETLQWDHELCRLFGVPIEHLPEIRPTVGSFAELDGVPVTAAIVDQQAALYGHGCRQEGEAKITFGTGAFVLAVTGKPLVRAYDRGLLPTVAWQIRGEEPVFAVDGGVYDAGAAVEWIQRLGLFDNFAELKDFDAPPAISRGLAFVPALSGLACPYWDRTATGLWIGMTARTTRADLCQAVLEGIALQVAEVVAKIGENISVSDALSADGGLVASPYFMQFLADATGRTIVTKPLHELTAYGCAALASLGAGEELRELKSGSKVYAPQTREGECWRERYASAVSKARGWRPREERIS